MKLEFDTGLLIEAGLKGLIWLMIAAGLVMVLRRASAASRYWAWSMGMCGLLAVPILSGMLPEWKVLPSWGNFESVKAQHEKPLHQWTQPSTPAGQAIVPFSVNGEPAASRPATGEFALAAGPEPEIVSGLFAPTPVKDRLAIVWLAGCLLLLIRLVVCQFGLILLTRKTREASGEMVQDLDGMAARFGIRRQVSLCFTDRRSLPMTWGILRPKILLPAEAVSWPAARLRAVLLHELAHIRRHDSLTQWLTQIAAALHWLNPLVWVALQRMEAEREQACDDLVLASGMKAPEYAGHVLEVASHLWEGAPARTVAMPMARQRGLEERVQIILDATLNRRAPGRSAKTWAVLFALALILPVSMVGTVEGSKANSEGNEKAIVATGAEPPVRKFVRPLGSTGTNTENEESQGSEEQGGTHVVQPGDSLYRIARRYEVSVRELIEANQGRVDQNALRVGQSIVIPRNAAASRDGSEGAVENAQNKEQHVDDRAAEHPSQSVERALGFAKLAGLASAEERALLDLVAAGRLELPEPPTEWRGPNEDSLIGIARLAGLTETETRQLDRVLSQERFSGLEALFQHGYDGVESERSVYASAVGKIRNLWEQQEPVLTGLEKALAGERLRSVEREALNKLKRSLDHQRAANILSVRRVFQPQPTTKRKASWSALFKRGDEDYYMSIAHVALGGEFPAQFNGEKEARFKVRMIDGNDARLKGQVLSPGPAEGRPDLLREIELVRDQPVRFRVEGHEYSLLYPSSHVSRADRSVSNQATLVISTDKHPDELAEDSPRLFEATLSIGETGAMFDLDAAKKHGPVVIGGESTISEAIDLSMPLLAGSDGTLSPALVGIGLQFFPLDGRDQTESSNWKLSRIQALLGPSGKESVIGGQFPSLATLIGPDDSEKKSFVFRTREGGEGILDVAIDREARTVDLKYRLF